MTVLRGAADEWCYPKPRARDRCALCRGPLLYPVLQWMANYRGPAPADGSDADAPIHFICKECCADIHKGFISDLQKMKALKEMRRLGFNLARPSDGTVFVSSDIKH
jgi:hypothetical protein